METNSNIEIRRCIFNTDKEWSQYITLQNEVYKERNKIFQKESFVKRFLNNPDGVVISFGAFFQDKMVANYSCIPKKMLIDGRIVKGLLSMATVTHPEFQGRGLFKTLAKMTYEVAKDEGYEFVVGVANANSFHGFMKYFQFTFVDRLQVKVGYGNNIQPKGNIRFSGYYDDANMKWRATCGSNYQLSDSSIEGKHGKLVRTYMGRFEQALLNKVALPKSKFSMLPKLYVGIGADIRSPYFNIPKFIKHSPFNLIFKDLTDGKLPEINKGNVFFQLWDYDVA